MTQAYFLFGNLVMTFARAYNGFFTSAVATGYLSGIVGVIIGNVVGAYVFRHISIVLLRYVIYIYIGITGMLFLLGV